MRSGAFLFLTLLLIELSMIASQRVRRVLRDDNVGSFCAEFKNTAAFRAKGEELNELRSGCSGRCIECQHCPNSCSKKIRNGCKNILLDMPAAVKIHSPLQKSCRAFIDKN